MWVRKDVFELVKDDRRRNRARFLPWLPLGMGLGIGLLMSLVAHFVGSRDWGPQPLGEAALGGLIIGALFLFGTYAVQILGWQFWFNGGRTKSLICEWCFKVVEAGRDKVCECGGQLESLDNWKWVEDPAPDSVRE